METPFSYCDELGPTKVIHVYEPAICLNGILVVDNTAVGPSIGGLRMATDVSVEECFRLARAMTLKNAMAGIPHGGGKSVLFGDPRMPAQEKEGLIRTFAAALKHCDEYIFGPDMGTNEVCMAWIKDEIGRAVGLPAAFGGIPLDQIGATAWGLYHAALVAEHYVDFQLEGARLVVQGWGAVGQHSARFLADQGVVLVGVSDSQGSIYNSDGLHVDALIHHKQQGGSVREFSGGEGAEREAVLDMACELWIPAARPDVINKENVARLNTQLILQGANIPITEQAEQILHERNVTVLPDFVVNAGGVICAAMEYQGASQSTAFACIKEKLLANTESVLAKAKSEGIPPRVAANLIAEARVREAMRYRRHNSFADF